MPEKSRPKLADIPNVTLARIVLRLAMIAIGAYLLMNSGCSTIAKTKPCQNLDWYEIGRQDGVNGESLKILADHRRACDGAEIPPDEDLYVNGRNAGLVEYCSPQGGLEAGKAGKVYELVCPDHLQAEFMPAYEVGRRIHLLEKDNAEIERRIGDIFSRLSKRGTRASEQSSLQSSLEDLRRRRAANETQINEIESKFIETL